MSAFHENHIRARSPGHYATLVTVFCEIDRIAARAMPVPSSYYGSEQHIHDYAAAVRPVTGGRPLEQHLYEEDEE